MDKIERKLVEIEARVIEQDHRLPHVISQFLARKNFPVEDPRRTAACKALVFACLFSPTIIAGGGGLLAILSIAILGYQNLLFTKQNSLIEDQNRYFREQNTNLISQLDLQKTQYDNQRRTEVTSILFDYVSENPALIGTADLTNRISKHNGRTRSEALREFITMERDRGGSIDLSGAILTQLNIVSANLSRIETSRETLFRGSQFKEIVCEDASFLGVELRSVQIDQGRFFNTTFFGVSFPGSRFADCSFLFDSRSQLLTNITKGRRYEGPELNRYGVIFGDFRQSSFNECTFSNAVFISESLNDDVIPRGNVFDSKFLTCDFTGDFGGTYFSDCTFDGVRFLGGSESESPFVGAVFRGGSVSMSEADCASSELVNTVFQDVDLSGLPLGCRPLFEPLLANGSLRNCKLPDSW